MSDFNPLCIIFDYALISFMTKISEAEFARICEGIYEDRATIHKYNPIGEQHETLLWMLLSCLVTYLSLSETEMPCFTGIPDSATYRQAILFVLNGRKSAEFEAEKYLDKLIEL